MPEKKTSTERGGVRDLKADGDEEITVRALLDLGLERAGGVKVEDQRDAGVGLLIERPDLRQRLRHGGGGENDELRLLLRRISRRGGTQRQRQQQGREFVYFRGVSSFFAFQGESRIPRRNRFAGDKYTSKTPASGPIL